MRIRIIAFATAAEHLGARETELELADGSSVADLLGHLQSQHPGFRELKTRLAIAVGGRLIDDDSDPLTDGAEVALLPPVSGGNRSERAALIRGDLDVASLLRDLHNPEHGALVLFFGRVRNSHRGEPVDYLVYDAYEQMALEALERICAELERETPSLRVRIIHRLGKVPAGTDSVVIAVSSPHRAEAYAANRQALERLKREVPIWKQEHYADGRSAWREVEPLRSTDQPEPDRLTGGR